MKDIEGSFNGNHDNHLYACLYLTGEKVHSIPFTKEENPPLHFLKTIRLWWTKKITVTNNSRQKARLSEWTWRGKSKNSNFPLYSYHVFIVWYIRTYTLEKSKTRKCRYRANNIFVLGVYALHMFCYYFIVSFVFGPPSVYIFLYIANRSLGKWSNHCASFVHFTTPGR